MKIVGETKVITIAQATPAIKGEQAWRITFDDHSMLFAAHQGRTPQQLWAKLSSYGKAQVRKRGWRMVDDEATVIAIAYALAGFYKNSLVIAETEKMILRMQTLELRVVEIAKKLQQHPFHPEAKEAFRELNELHEEFEELEQRLGVLEHQDTYISNYLAWGAWELPEATDEEIRELAISPPTEAINVILQETAEA